MALKLLFRWLHIRQLRLQMRAVCVAQRMNRSEASPQRVPWVERTCEKRFRRYMLLNEKAAGGRATKGPGLSEGRIPVE